MAITLEKIKEMNIPSGAPIEMYLKADAPKNSDNKTYKSIGYFVRIFESMEDPQVMFNVSTGSKWNANYPVSGGIVHLSDIESIRILEYKK